MTDESQAGAVKPLSDHLMAYGSGLASTAIVCGALFLDHYGLPWSWPSGIALAWAVISTLFGLIAGLANDNLPPRPNTRLKLPARVD
jgi:hypothetical protein